MAAINSDTLSEAKSAQREEHEKIGSYLEMMKAVRIHEYGGTEKLQCENVPIPVIGPDEVLVKVHSAGVNPVDWKVRDGQFKGSIAHKFPLILGWDVFGTIVQTGKLVSRFTKGEFIVASLDVSLNGSYAEYVAVKSKDAAFAPKVPANGASAVPLAAQTAWAGLFEVGNLKAGQRVLIRGGSGGVGTFAVQLAKIAGANVIATTSGLNANLVKSLGADQVLDYTQEEFGELRGIDMIFDTIGGDAQAHSWKVLKKGGLLVSTVGVDEKGAAERGVFGKSFTMIPNGSRLQEISNLIDKGMLRVIVEKIFPLSEAGKAHELSKSGKTRGKIILHILNDSGIPQMTGSLG